MGKRINIICNYSSIYGGNFIPSILHLCKKLDCELILFSFPRESENRNWVNSIKSKGYSVCFYDRKSFRKDILGICKANKIDVIYTHFISGLRIKMVFPFNHKIKLFIHVHSDFSGNNKLSFKQRARKLIENKFIRTDATYIFVQNGLCLERVENEKLDRETFVKKYDVDSSKTIFLLFGWSPYIKGVDLAVKAFSTLSTELQNMAKLIIVHGKDEGKKVCLDFLTKQIGNNSFLNNSNIVFVPPTEDVFSLYKLSDVYVMSSRSEGFSYSLIEALYFNLNCIVNDIEGCAWSKQYNNCSFFKTNDIDNLSQLFKKYIGTKSNHNINSSIQNQYNIDIWSNDIMDILPK